MRDETWECDKLATDISAKWNFKIPNVHLNDLWGWTWMIKNHWGTLGMGIMWYYYRKDLLGMKNGDLLFLKPCTLFPLFYISAFYHECRKQKVGIAYCDSKSFCCTYIQLLMLHHPKKMQNKRYLLLGSCDDFVEDLL